MERKSYENKSIVADGARVYLGNSITAEEPGGALRRGLSQAGVYHNLWGLMNEGVGGDGVSTHSPHTVGWKRYKRAPRERESGQASVRVAVRFISTLLCVTECVYASAHGHQGETC